MRSKKITFFLFSILFSIQVIKGQEKILEFNTDYLDTPLLMENSFTMVDDVSGDFTVFLTRNSDISAYHFNAAFENEGRLLSRQLHNKYKVPLGGTLKQKKYSLFYTNSSKSKFAGITFDFESRWSNTFEIDLNLKKEIYLTRFLYQNTFYIVTSTYRENFLYIYAFDNFGTYKKRTIDLSKYEFYGASEYPTRLKSALALDYHNANHLTNIISVQNDIPYSLDSMVSLIKLYIIGDSLHLATDINRDFTQIISYNLQNGSTSYDKINHVVLEQESLRNSYLLDKLLFQISVNQNEMVFQVTDLNSKKVLKKHHITKDEELYLANGPIRQRGGRYKQYRELEKTSQFLRKLGNGNPAIHVNESNGQYVVNIGSVDEVKDGVIGVLAYLNPYGAFAAFGALTLYVNPVALALYKVSNSKAVYINNILNEDFEPTNNKERDDIFYIIDDYIKKEDIKRYTAADVFKYKDYFFFGMLDKKSKNYSFIKFIN